MKRLTFLLTLVSVVQLSAQAQGTFNASNNYTVPGATQKAFVSQGSLYGPLDWPLPKAIGRVQIVNAADGSTLSPGGDAGVGLTLDGLFFINGISVPGTPTGGTANIIVRAWDSSTGSTWETAHARSSWTEGLVTVTDLGGGTTPAATFALNSNFDGLIVYYIPEPATVVLAVVGVAGLMVAARPRK